MSKMAHFCIYCWWQQKTSHNLGKIFKFIWKISFSSFRKCYNLLYSEPPLARCQPLKRKYFVAFSWLSSSSDISTISILPTVTPKFINHTIFWKNTVRSGVRKYFAQVETNFLLPSAENTKNEPFLTF